MSRELFNDRGHVPFVNEMALFIILSLIIPLYCQRDDTLGVPTKEEEGFKIKEHSIRMISA